jgi:signal transduction histidine kinase
MPTTSPQIVSLTIIISTLFLLLFGSIIIRYIFLFQRKKFLHHQEVFKLREAFNNTLLQSKLEIQEQTLDHIGKELHANISHLASVININLQEMLPHGPPAMKESIMETKAVTKQLLADLRSLIAGLNTDHIMHIGFNNAINNELERLKKTAKCQVVFTKIGQGDRLQPSHEIILFRLSQEIFNNILKYAKAKTVTVIITHTPELFQLEITDDGIGFNMESVIAQSAHTQSTGLINIRERAKQIEAQLVGESTLGVGTKFTISIQRQQKDELTNYGTTK